MEQVIQVTGLCVVGALLALVVKRGSPETALLLAVGAALVVALAIAAPSIRQWWAFQTRKRRALAGRKGEK